MTNQKNQSKDEFHDLLEKTEKQYKDYLRATKQSKKHSSKEKYDTTRRDMSHPLVARISK